VSSRDKAIDVLSRFDAAIERRRVELESREDRQFD
jgi:hypothetical protein